MVRNIVFILCLTLIIVGFGIGGDYYVTTTGNDASGDGSTIKPWKTISHALSVLDGTPSNPHVIHVAPGTYSPSQTGESFPLLMKSYISLQGAGDSITVLLAESLGPFLRRVIECDSIVNVSVLGFTLRQGWAPLDDHWNTNNGGGMLIRNSAMITISHNIFTRNRARNVKGGWGMGGGLYAYQSSFLLITDNKFLNNFASADGAIGGAIAIEQSMNSIISYNTISNNSVGGIMSGDGGGIWSSSDVIIMGNNIIDNHSDNLGGGTSCEGSGLLIRNNIQSDTCGYIGGGVVTRSNYTSPIIGGSLGNGNNIYNNTAATESDLQYPAKGNQIANLSQSFVDAKFNYFGNINPHNTSEVYGNVNIDPYMASPIVFDTSNLVIVPSPINFDTVTLGKSRGINVILFNVTNSLVDSIKINSIICQNANISLSEQTFILNPAGRHSMLITLTPTSTGILSDSLRIETNIGEFIIPLNGIVVDSTTVVEKENAILPANYILKQNYPNPFNPSTIINYHLPSVSYVTLKIYNVFGQEVATPVDGIQEAGYKSVEFDASNLSSGIYYYKITMGYFVDVKKMILIK